MDQTPHIMATLWSQLPELIQKIRRGEKQKIALLGNGEHTRMLHEVWIRLDGPKLNCILTSQADEKTSRIESLPLIHLSAAHTRDIDCVILSSQTFENELYNIAKKELPNVAIVKIHCDPPHHCGSLTSSLLATHLKKSIFHILDLGAIDLFKQADARSRYWPLIPNSHLQLYCFEPDQAICDELESEGQRRGIHIRAFPTAISDRTGFETLHITRDRTGSSFYRPWQERLSRYYYVDGVLSESMNTVQEQQIPTDTLDNILNREELTLPDFIKMNIEGSELNAIKGGNASFAKALGIQTELNFSAKSPKGPLFSDVDPYLRNSGFEFADILALNKYGRKESSIIAYDQNCINHQRDGAVSIPRRQSFEGHFLYLRETESITSTPNEETTERLLKLACIAEMYGQIEYAFSAARIAASRSDADDASSILESVSKSEKYYTNQMLAYPKNEICPS